MNAQVKSVVTTRHTPTPWTANGSAIETDAKPWICVAHVYSERNTDGVSDVDESTADADANAAFIVRACNAHDELLAALCDAANDLAALRRHYAKEMSPGYRYAVDEEIARARAAIAKAEGK